MFGDVLVFLLAMGIMCYMIESLLLVFLFTGVCYVVPLAVHLALLFTGNIQY